MPSVKEAAAGVALLGASLVCSAEIERRYVVNRTKPVGRTMPLWRQLWIMTKTRVRHPLTGWLLVGHHYKNRQLRFIGPTRARMIACHIENAPIGVSISPDPPRPPR